MNTYFKFRMANALTIDKKILFEALPFLSVKGSWNIKQKLFGDLSVKGFEKHCSTHLVKIQAEALNDTYMSIPASHLQLGQRHRLAYVSSPFPW